MVVCFALVLWFQNHLPARTTLERWEVQRVDMRTEPRWLENPSAE
jgi:hypothetical protein